MAANTTEVINLNCMIDDLASYNEILEGNSPRLTCEILVHEMIEDALVESVEGPELQKVESVVSDLVDVVSTTSELVDGAVLNLHKEQSAKEAHENQLSVQQKILDLYGSVLSDNGTPPKLGRTAKSYDSIISDVSYEFESIADSASHLIQVISSTQESIELVDALSELSSNMEKRSSLIQTIPSQYARRSISSNPINHSSSKNNSPKRKTSKLDSASPESNESPTSPDRTHSSEKGGNSQYSYNSQKRTTTDRKYVPKKASKFVGRLRKMNDIYRLREVDKEYNSQQGQEEEQQQQQNITNPAFSTPPPSHKQSLEIGMMTPSPIYPYEDNDF